ncbi:kinase-like domain-containing protein [Thelephora terrestris]|uniref:Kinase-like domain-containing protein n=1 Tax=Thelephora terrestris TaxID=56493 RepID=A0A9P6HL73_9AGAM|nr:kinase-like domain-containing protein [Thelephora terrestris]
MSERKFYGELVMWKRLQHPNIVPVRGVTTEIPQSFEIVCDWMVNGNITEYVRKNSKAKPIELLWDVADGIHYLHSCEIIHGDLKAANILIDKDGYACLTDFGLASMIRRNEPAEIPNGGTVTKEMDIFRFAMVAVEVCIRGVFDGVV